jgi:hypothetical protein
MRPNQTLDSNVRKGLCPPRAARVALLGSDPLGLGFMALDFKSPAKGRAGGESLTCHPGFGSNPDTMGTVIASAHGHSHHPPRQHGDRERSNLHLSWIQRDCAASERPAGGGAL